MFDQKFFPNLKKAKRNKSQKIDVIAEQVKKTLQTSDQKIILMVRG